MTDLFDIEVTQPDPKFVHIRNGDSDSDVALRDALNKYWVAYEPFAGPRFRQRFAKNPVTHFWEMYLAGELIGAGKQLVSIADRATSSAQPALCVKDNDRHVWIELSVPIHNTGPDQPQEQRFENEGGSLEEAPLHEAQRRITSAMDTKHEILEGYLASDLIHPDDVRLVAVCGCCLGLDVPESDVRLVMSAVFPIIKESVQIDTETGELVERIAEATTTVAKIEGQVSKKSDIENAYPHVSGIIWSKISLTDMSREHCPFTFMHNPLAAVPLQEGWGVWDHELVVMERDANWDVLDILEPVAPEEKIA
jgi:hypothetical protein